MKTALFQQLNPVTLSKHRQRVRSLETNPQSQFIILGIVALIYFIELVGYVVSLESFSIAPLLSQKGAILGFFVLVFTGLMVFVTMQASSLAFWIGSRCCYGGASLQQTRAAVIVALGNSVVLGFFWNLFYLSYRLRDALPTLSPILGVIFSVGLVGSLIYTFIVLTITLSEVNRVKLGKAVVIVTIGFVALATITLLLRPAYYWLH